MKHKVFTSIIHTGVADSHGDVLMPGALGISEHYKYPVTLLDHKSGYELKTTLRGQILHLAEVGLNIKQIADRLGVSRSTVSYHIKPGQKEKVMEKTKRLRAAKRAVKSPKAQKATAVKPTKLKILKAPKQPKAQKTDNMISAKKINDRKSFKTKPVDLKALIAVKLDAKTTIYVKPGTDIKKTLDKFNNRRV